MPLFSTVAATLLLAAAPLHTPGAAGAPDEVSCIKVVHTGSILTERVCHTATEWARLRETERDICGPATTTARGHCGVQLTSGGPQTTIRTRN